MQCFYRHNYEFVGNSGNATSLQKQKPITIQRVQLTPTYQQPLTDPQC